MSAKIYAIANQKGGVGKTTTCQFLAAGLLNRDKKVLLLDLDPQSNLSVLCGATTDAVEKETPTMLEVLSDKARLADTIQHTSNYDIVPASMYLASIDNVLTDPIGRPFKLAEKLDAGNVRKIYDYILIDCPPALGTLTSLAVIAADSVIIPAQADILSLQGVSQLYNTIESARRHANKRLRIAGIVMTRYNGRTNISKEIMGLFQNAAVQMQTKVFHSTIREATVVKEAQASKRNLFDIAGTSGVVQDYHALIEEIFFNGAMEQ